jgi:hypothetical protein
VSEAGSEDTAERVGQAGGVGEAGGAGVLARWIEVGRDELGRVRQAAGRLTPGPGDVLFRVERFGFSANNITYGLLGDSLGYWDLFPAAPGWGQLPVWGCLRVEASSVPGLEPGQPAFGLCPMGTHVLLRPGRVSAATFTEGSPHRSGLSSIYNVYALGQPGEAEVVLRPVFWLSFVLDDYLAEREARPVVVTSGSSKAALGLAFLLARRGVRVTGLTSAAHAGFVAGLGLYDQVMTYDQASPEPSAVLVDLAGRAALRDRIGAAEVIVAGGTHQGSGLAPEGLFSAPDRIRARAQEWGWPVLEERFSSALSEFAGGASWLRIEHARGLDAAVEVYRRVLGNVTDPAVAHLIQT